MKLQRTLILIAATFLVIGGVISSGIFGLNWKFLDRYLHVKFPSIPNSNTLNLPSEKAR